jgi:hypothetical protein
MKSTYVSHTRLSKGRVPKGEALMHTPEYDEHVVKAPAHNLAAAFDRWNARENKLGKGFRSFETSDALLTWYAKQTPKSCYELLRETAPIALGFDIECEFGNDNHSPVMEREGLSREPDAFIDTVLERIRLAFPQLHSEVPLVCTSHKTGVKLSFHLKFARFSLRNMAERDAFTREIRERLALLIPLVDPSVYSKRRQMRLPFSHKFGDSTRPLLPGKGCKRRGVLQTCLLSCSDASSPGE